MFSPMSKFKFNSKINKTVIFEAVYVCVGEIITIIYFSASETAFALVPPNERYISQAEKYSA